MLDKRLMLLTIFIVGFLAISTANASDNVTSDVVSMEKMDDDVVSIDDAQTVLENASVGSFSQLSDLVSNSSEGSVINLYNDYQYDENTDENYKDGIELKAITLEGNGHMINGNGNARIFNIMSENVTINNLKLVNGHAENGGAINANYKVTCNDVVFQNNHAISGGGAIYVVSKIDLNRCIFEENFAPKGAAIFFKSRYVPRNDTLPFDPAEFENDNYTDDDNYTFDENDTIDDNESYENQSDEDFMPKPDSFINYTIFRNFYNISQAVIFAEAEQNVEIKNSRFENIVSEYGTAAYLQDVNLFLKNVTFTNLRATVTGGAIALVASRAEIENSTFVNLYAPKNGGAIYCDMNGWNKANYNEIVIANSNFENCSSDFGGAIALMCGELKISNSTFNSNFAEYDGGAIYTSQSFLIDINNSTFSNNRLNHTADGGLSFGGALFTAFSGEGVKINNTRFINNSNNAVYCYAINMTLSNSYFENNGQAIRSVYPIELNLNGNEYNGDGIVEKDHDEFYRLVANSSSIKLVLINNSIDVNNPPSRFNAFDWGWVTPFKNQGFSGGCWCFSTVSVLETALLKSTGVAYDFSEQNLQKLLMQYSKYGNTELVEAGQTDIAAEFLLSWWGPVPDELDRFSMIGKVTRIIPLAENIHVQDVVILEANESIDAIKRAILKYGSITSDFLSDTSSPNFNNVTSAYYCNRTGVDASHAIAVVGWDDNYSASNFINTPPGDGAWIIKNSYGNESFDHGFIYVSYYDKLIFKTSQSVGFIFSNLENYTKNYQTDIGGEVSFKYKGKTYSYKNSYCSIGNDMISAVGTYFDSADESYALKIYVNGALKLTQRGTSPFRGFHTVVLSKEIPIKTGDNFTVVMEKNSVPVLNNSNTFFKNGVSFVNYGNGWEDVSLDNRTVVLKVYTKDLPNPLTTSVSASDVSCVYNGGKYLTVNLRDIYGDPIKNLKVAVVLNGKTYNPTTNSKGQAKVLLNGLAPKTYTAKITYNGSAKYAKSTATAKVTVKKANVKMTANAKKFKKSVRTKKYTIILKTNRNKFMKGVKVTLKVNGKIYKAKTNSKGKATFKITGLTKKGKYTAVVKYSGNKYYKAKTAKPKITVK